MNTAQKAAIKALEAAMQLCARSRIAVVAVDGSLWATHDDERRTIVALGRDFAREVITKRLANNYKIKQVRTHGMFVQEK